MLSQEYRLRKDKEIKTVFKKGKSFYSKILGVKFLSNELENSRFAFVVSNKVSKKAVKRNLLKRRLRGIIQLNLAKIQGNYDVVIITRARVGIMDKKYQELEKDLLWVLKKIKLLK